MFREIRKREKITERDKKKENYKQIKPEEEMSLAEMFNFIDDELHKEMYGESKKIAKEYYDKKLQMLKGETI